MIRVTLEQDFLEVLVYAKLYELLTARKSFTAYDVTTLLREDNRGLEITHEDVRDTVHAIMGTPVIATIRTEVDNVDIAVTEIELTKGYKSEDRRYGNNTAQTYYPTDTNDAFEVKKDSWGTWTINPGSLRY